MSNVVEGFVLNLLAEVPQITVATVGLILVRTRLKGLHPRACLHGTIGLSLLLVTALWSAASRALIQYYFTQVQDRQAFTNRLTIANVVGFVVLIAALSFLVAAILADRNQAGSSRERP